MTKVNRLIQGAVLLSAITLTVSACGQKESC
ncbi:lipoprotein [Paenibacillus hexagrammi]|uniref:Lipoprotein n=1 Tax=Paenibacillus hexagrammi TaxID=2908839 RepID=A0ABY3SRM6_9BACL|nr:lipoprotein [Paenibacillus sp. YPD9-1]UJF36118.1 lipoprotein [Paenibacillus sp. YPD9-1]